jgi:predicted ATPase/class 3 adenylate cyclase
MTDNYVACQSCGSQNSQSHNFCGRCGASLGDSSRNEAAPTAKSPERRHLTVVFCDLVGSTALSERLDPEDLSDVILSYREVAAAAIARYDGYVARYIGDGILAYFGYPRAHEDDPARAVRASLEVIAGIRGLAQTLGAAKHIELSVRIGVHCGLVVVGELARGAVREEAGVLGETPNLASRLMSLAPADSILVSDVVHSLIKGHFESHEFGVQQLKGISRPIALFEVTGVRANEGALDLGHSAAEIAGRERELAHLRACWDEVIRRGGRAASIVGDPGIGKSRLVRAFADSLTGTDHLKIVFYCSPYFSNTALYPIVDYLTRWLQRADVDKFDQLEAAVRAAGMLPKEIVPVIAALLSLPLTSRYERPQVSARLQRQHTMEFLYNWLVRQAATRPVLLVVEDLHWSDASTREFVDFLVKRIHRSNIFLIFTTRPTFQSGWPVPASVDDIRLDKLAPSHIRKMIGNITGANRLPDFICDQLVAKTDGVPLFVEELTKAVIESREAVEATAEGQLNPPAFDIPISLQATLMARLDSLSSGKAVAQRAAVIGREFTRDLLAVVMEVPEAECDDGIAQLLEAELVFQSDPPPRARYIFKHSLIQEAAYRSLLRTKRREYHRQIAEALISHFNPASEIHPELVAHHYSSAHMEIAAANYWRKAGELALGRSANVEAYAHVKKGLHELTVAPRSSLHVKEEVALLITLGSVLTALKGYAAPEVEQTYARARELCNELDDPSHLFPVLRGLQSFYIVRGPLRVAHELVEQLHRMAEDAGDAVQRVEANRRLGWCLFCMGNIEFGRIFLDRSVKEYDRSRSAQHIATYGSDPAVIGLVNLAWLEWFAGRPDEAKRYSKRSVSLARELGFPLGLGYAVGMSAALYQCLNDPKTTTEMGTETIELAEKYGFPYWVAWERSLIGWARAMQGDTAVGVDELQAGLAAYRETGAELFCPHILGLLAQVTFHARRFDEALSYCEEALMASERSNAHFFDAELHRLEGECILGGERNVAAAEACFDEAISLARVQGARMLELRGATSLAKLKYAEGRTEIASRLLADAIVLVKGDEAVADLKEAQRLLRAWSGAES